MTLLCGAATSAVGPIGFVGLTVPHLARMITGPDNRWHAWARRIAESGVDLDALWDEAESFAPHDEEAALDAYEERLDRAGLLG